MPAASLASMTSGTAHTIIAAFVKQHGVGGKPAPPSRRSDIRPRITLADAGL
jgi:hypothetical protein